jgi:hypothetical protein
MDPAYCLDSNAFDYFDDNVKYLMDVSDLNKKERRIEDGLFSWMTLFVSVSVYKLIFAIDVTLYLY